MIRPPFWRTAFSRSESALKNEGDFHDAFYDSWLTVANRRFDEFRVTLVQAPIRVARFPLTAEAAKALGIEDGASVRAVPLAPKDR